MPTTSRPFGEPDSSAAITPDHLVVRAAGLTHVADPLADPVWLSEQIAARDRGLAAARRQQRGEHAQRRRLAGAVGSEEPKDLPGADGQVHAGHRLDDLLSRLEHTSQPMRRDRRFHNPNRHDGYSRGSGRAISLRPSCLMHSKAGPKNVSASSSGSSSTTPRNTSTPTARFMKKRSGARWSRSSSRSRRSTDPGRSSAPTDRK